MGSGESRASSRSDVHEGSRDSSAKSGQGQTADATGRDTATGNERDRGPDGTSPVVDLFGVVHFDRRGKVIRELDEIAAESDALCIEAPEGGLNLRAFLTAFARTPTYVIGFFTMFLLVQGPMFVLFNRDVVPTEVLASATVADDRTVHKVDDIEQRLLLDAGWPVVVSNWLLYGLLVFQDPVGSVVTSVLLVGGSLGVYAVRHGGYRRTAVLAMVGVWALGTAAVVLGGYLSAWLLLVAFLTTVVLAIKGVSGRNEHMLERVELVAAEHGYDRVTLVAGRSHLDGLIRDSPGFEASLGVAHWSRWLRSGKTDLEPEPAADPGDSSSGASLRDISRRRRQRRSESHVDPEMGTEDEVLTRRLLAVLVDVFGVGLFTVGIGILGAILSIISSTLLSLASPDLSVQGVMFVGVIVGPLLGPILYFPILEVQYGRTLGKLLTGLVVVQSDGSGVTTKGALLRNLLRPVDALLLMGVPLLLVTERCQRLGDLLADTVVVRTSGCGR